MTALLTLRSMVELATPGEWEAVRELENFENGESAMTLTGDFHSVGFPEGWTVDLTAEANAALIVTAVRALRVLTEEGVVEAIARLIDPGSWVVLDSYLAEMLRKYKGENAGYNPEAFKDRLSMAKAREILNYLASLAFTDQATGGDDG
jgi:hypothetical protein